MSVIIGLDSLYAAKLKIGENGVETYETPVALTGVTEASISPSVSTADVTGDDTIMETISAFQSVDVSFTLNDVDTDKYALLLGKKVDANGVILDDDNVDAPYFALMFRSKKSNGEYRYVCLYKGKFSQIEESYSTDAGNADYKTQAVSGKFIKNADGLWRTRVDSDSPNLGENVIANWFKTPYVPQEAPTV